MIKNIAVVSPLRQSFLDVSFEYNEEKFKASLSFSSGGVWELWSVFPNGGESARKMAAHFSNQELYFFEEALLADSRVLAAAQGLSSERELVLA